MKDERSRERFDQGVKRYKSTYDFCRTFYNTVRPSGRLYLDGDHVLTYVDPLSGPRRLLSLDDFFPVAHDLVDVRMPGQNERDIPATLRREETALLFQSEARTLLPRLKAVIYEPVAVPRARGGYEILETPGYDSESRVYYWRRDGAPVISRREGTEHLARCFSGLPFFSEHHKSNVFAWLLGAVVLDPRVSPPMLVVTGNGQNVGKSSLVSACGIILTGSQQASVEAGKGEFMKQLSARFIESGRFISIDNVVTRNGRTYKNDGLARILTEGYSKKVRILGHSRSITQSGVLFALTANDCSLDTDLATRSLMVQLWKAKRGPMDPYCVDYAFDHRNEIYGELLNLAVSNPPSIVENLHLEFRFRAWLDFVHPRVTAAFGRDLALDDADELDSRLQDLYAYGADHLDKQFTVKDLLKEIDNHLDRYDGLREYIETARSDRAKATRIGGFLAEHIGVSYTPEPGVTYQLVLAGQDGTTKAKTYKFQEKQ